LPPPAIYSRPVGNAKVAIRSRFAVAEPDETGEESEL
jgi:hypothetical protein